MRRQEGEPTRTAFAKWWTAQPEGFYTCADCGQTDAKSFVQPQHPFYADGRAGVARCCGCIGKRNTAATAARKAALAAEPRCEVNGCQRRGAWKVGRGVLLCGAHKALAMAGHARAAASCGGMALFLPMDYNRADVLTWASGH